LVASIPEQREYMPDCPNKTNEDFTSIIICTVSYYGTVARTEMGC
jgi:hypothetical protein